MNNKNRATNVLFACTIHCLLIGSMHLHANESTATAPANVQAADFTVVTTIDEGDPAAPISVHRMVHREGVAYDLPQTQSRFVTVLDLKNDRMTLLDRQTRTRCDISTESLLTIAASAVSQVVDPQKREKLGLNAKVQPTGEGSWMIAYPGVRYDVQSHAASDPAMAVAYGQFIDWMCRLNMVRPRGLPPFARMKLNETLTQQLRLASETTLRCDSPNGTAVTYHSLSNVSPVLDGESIRQLDEVAGMMVLYQDVPWEDFPRD